MKSVITASAIFILIIVLISVSVWYVNDFVDKMLQYLYKNENYVAKNAWQDAEDEMDKMVSTWVERRHVMSVLFNHSFIDKLDVSIEKMKNITQNQKKEDFFYEKSNFYLLLLNLQEQQKISVGNIF